MKDRTIVAYGDSHTSTSYPRHLRDLIHKYLHENGDPFSGSVMKYAMPGVWFSENTVGTNQIGLVIKEQPDACIVLGGTNDLECTSIILPDEILNQHLDALYRGLVSIYERLRDGHIEPVLVTIPSFLGHQ